MVNNLIILLLCIYQIINFIKSFIKYKREREKEDCFIYIKKEMKNENEKQKSGGMFGGYGCGD